MIFGWHSVVYIYKDTGYFSDHCPAQKLTPSSDNITSQFRNPGFAHSSVSPLPAYLSPNDAVSSSVNMADFPSGGVTSPLSNITPPAYHKTANANEEGSSSVHFDELSCEERIQVRAGEGASQTCKSQDEQFNLIFSLATGVNGILSFPSGILYDRLGTRVSRLFSMCVYSSTYCCGTLNFSTRKK